MSKKLLNGMTPKHLFQAEAPEQKVTLKDGRTIKLHEVVLDTATKLEDAFEEATQRCRQARHDPGRNKRGRDEAVREANDALAEKIREVAGDIPMDELEERLEELEGQLLDLHPRLDPDDTERAFEVAEKAREVRQVIRDMDENERTQLLMKAAREDNRPVLLAFEDSPLPLVGEDELTLAREAHARVRYPDRWERLDAIRSGIRVLRANVNGAMGRVAEQSGDPRHELRPFGRSGRAEAVERAEAVVADAE